jgi:hypothetical protein
MKKSIFFSVPVFTSGSSILLFLFIIQEQGLRGLYDQVRKQSIDKLQRFAVLPYGGKA